MLTNPGNSLCFRGFSSQREIHERIEEKKREAAQQHSL